MQIGYARVSTEDQNLALQLDAFERAGIERIYTDKASGAARKREGLTQCLREIERGDVLVVWRLDRLARSLRQLLDLMEHLETRGVGFRSLTESIDTTTAGGRLILHVMGAIAEFERQLIRERTVAGLKAAQDRGVKVGRKLEATSERIEEAKRLIVAGSSVKAAAEAVGLAQSTLFRDLKGWDRKTLGPPQPDDDNDVDIPTI